MVAQLIGSREVEEYLHRTQELLSQLDLDCPEDGARLEELICNQLEEWRGEEPLEALLQGERAFYRGVFQEAIEWYSAAKEVPLSSFFCYRALAHLYAEQGRTEEALVAIEKALDLSPTDGVSVQLSDRLLQAAEDFDEEPLFDSFPEEEEPTAPSVATLIEKIQQGKEQHDDLFYRYAHESRQCAEEERASLLLLDGWEATTSTPTAAFLPELYYRGSTGLLLRWEGRGIAINPGPHFLARLHQSGRSIAEIDFVIVTRCGGVCPAELEEIHALNDRSNRVTGARHVIQYYLEEEAYRSFSQLLEPRYKQERNSVHPLRRYLDSTEIERILLDEGIELSYLFPKEQKGEGVLARLDLTETKEVRPQKCSIGYLSGSGWCLEMVALCTGCDLLFASFGRTEVDECEKAYYLSTCLGYYGASTLAHEVRPALLLLGEFDSRSGDLRTDVVGQLRDECRRSGEGVTVLPAEVGLTIDLHQLKVRCTMSEQWAKPDEICLVRPTRPFGPLHLLSSSSLL